MKRTILLCLALIGSASACGDETVVGGPGLPDPAADDGSELSPPAEDDESDGGESGAGMPDVGVDEPDPDPSRVFTAFADGDDHVFLATVGDEVLGHYPDADHWAIRIAPTGTSLAVLFGDDGERLDLVRVRPQAPLFFEGQPDTRQVCFPDVLDITAPICVTEPCEYDDAPKPGQLPDCVETSAGSDGEQITVMGSIEGIPVGRLVTPEGTSDLTGIELGQEQVARMGVVGDLLDDLAAIVPDMEPLGPTCLDCWWDEFVFGATVASCVVFEPTCVGLLPQIDGVLDCQNVEC